ncbi:TPA: hypothetical protein ACH3X1_008354 [Trebouxia sp. C0004]
MKFSSVNSYRQDLLPTCKAFPKETATCIWFTQCHKVCNSTAMVTDVHMSVWDALATRVPPPATGASPLAATDASQPAASMCKGPEMQICVNRLYDASCRSERR